MDARNTTFLALALMAMAAGSAAASELAAVRVLPPATLQHEGKPSALIAPKSLFSGDVVSAGVRGKVGLTLAGNGQMILSSLGDLQVFEATAAKKGQPASAKLKLLAGALRVDSRATNGRAPQDVRLNVGSLKTRIYNADAWAANTAEGDSLCVIAGAVSVQTEGGEQRLDKPGSCLRREPDGHLRTFAAGSDAVIVGAIDATRFDDSDPAPQLAVATPAPIIAAAPAAPAKIEPQRVMPDDKGGWTVVVLSLSRAEPVAARAEALVAQGLPASTRQVEVKGLEMHRVTVGRFASQAEARAYAADTLAKSGIQGWVAPL